MKESRHTSNYVAFAESTLLVLTVLTLFIMLSACSQFNSEESFMIEELSQTSDLKSESISTAAGSNTLTLQKLTSHCAESGNTNFDPTNLEYLVDPSNTFSFAFNVAYGNHDNDADGVIDQDSNNDGKGDLDNFRNRRVFDILYHKTGSKRPLVIFFHGGGFAAGDKCVAYNYRKMPVKEILDAGAAFATVNYRFLGYTNSQNQKVPYDTNKGVITALKDGKRLIQVLRANANRYNIDKNRVLVMGGSAGAGIALWNSVMDDGADLSSTKIVARQSTKPNALIAIGVQSTYDFNRWENEIFHQGSNYMYRRWRYAQYAVNQNGFPTNHDFPDCRYWNYQGESIACDDPNRPIGRSAVDYYGHAGGIKAVLGYTGAGEPAAEPGTTSYQKYLDETKSMRKKVDIISMISADDPIMYLEALDVPDNVTVPTAGTVYHSKYHAIAVNYVANLVGVRNQLQIGYQRGLNQRQLRFNFINAHIIK